MGYYLMRNNSGYRILNYMNSNYFKRVIIVWGASEFNQFFKRKYTGRSEILTVVLDAVVQGLMGLLQETLLVTQLPAAFYRVYLHPHG